MVVAREEVLEAARTQTLDRTEARVILEEQRLVAVVVVVVVPQVAPVHRTWLEMAAMERQSLPAALTLAAAVGATTVEAVWAEQAAAVLADMVAAPQDRSIPEAEEEPPTHPADQVAQVVAALSSSPFLCRCSNGPLR